MQLANTINLHTLTGCYVTMQATLDTSRGVDSVDVGGATSKHNCGSQTPEAAFKFGSECSLWFRTQENIYTCTDADTLEAKLQIS